MKEILFQDEGSKKEPTSVARQNDTLERRVTSGKTRLGLWGILKSVFQKGQKGAQLDGRFIGWH